MNDSQLKLVYSIDEAAEAMGLSTVHLRRRVRTGLLPARKEGARILILKQDLHDYLAGLPLVVARETTDAA